MGGVRSFNIESSASGSGARLVLVLIVLQTGTVFRQQKLNIHSHFDQVMGLAFGWFEETNELLPNLPNLEWMEKMGNNPYFGVSRNRTKLADGTSKPICVVIDAAGWLFKTFSYNNSRPARTIGDLADVQIEKLNLYLKNPAVTCVMFLFDRKTPNIKTVSRRPDDSTPETPFHLLAGGFTGNEEQKAAAAWRIKLSQNRDATDRGGLRLSGASITSSRSFLLPPLKRSLPQQQSDSAGTKRTEFAYEECLKNRHFKRWLSKELSSLILDTIEVPEGKSLIISGPDMCIQKSDDQMITPDEKFRYSYMEVDNSVGYWAAVLAEDYDVDIDSEDGDTVITGLLGCHLRMRPDHSVMGTDRAFINRLRLLRNQWAGERITSVIDINNLYTTLQYMHCALGMQHNITVHNPIGNYALLAFAGGCDYVDGGMLIGVSKTVLLKTYFTYFPLFAQTLVSSHIDNPSQVTVNMDAFARLILCCYRNVRGKGKLGIPVDNLADGCRMLRENDARAAGRPYPTPASVRVLAGNICWTLTYFASGSVKLARIPDGLTLMNGLPVYGYTSVAKDDNIYGFNIVDHADDANVRSLNWKHKDRHPRNPEEWNDETLTDLKKPT